MCLLHTFTQYNKAWRGTSKPGSGYRSERCRFLFEALPMCVCLLVVVGAFVCAYGGQDTQENGTKQFQHIPPENQ
jgi:hypothetical protein